MKFFTHDITVGGITVPLHGYIPDPLGYGANQDNRPAIIVFPGGGYEGLTCWETEPIALKYAAEGICAFLLMYSYAPVRFPIPQLQAFLAIRYVREHAKEYGINPNNIATTGYSAGGHLSASTGVLWNKPEFWAYCEPYDPLNDVGMEMYRPNKLVLSYAVLKSDTEYHHHGSFENLLGDRITDDALLSLVACDKQVDDNTPPAFLWHTAEDDLVHVRNSIDFAGELAKRGIPAELHIYPHGGHGLGLGTCVTSDVRCNEPLDIADWFERSVRFVYDESMIKA